MCTLCDEAKGLRHKDRDLLERDTTVTLEMRHGIRVEVSVLKFKADKQRIKEHFCSNHISRHETLQQALPPRYYRPMYGY